MEMDDHKRRRNMILYVLIAFALYLVLNQVLSRSVGVRPKRELLSMI